MTTLNTAQPAHMGLSHAAGSYNTAFSTNNAASAPAADSGSATTAKLPDTEKSVQITLSQAGIDFLANTSSATSAYLASAQLALGRLDQLAKSGHASAKEQAEEKVNILKAQMRQLMQFKALMSPKALAQALAQLAQQLAAAVAQYTQSGGSNAAIGNALLATPQGTSGTQGAPATQTQQTDADTGQNSTATDSAQAAPSPANVTDTKNSENQDFAQSVRGLAAQIKALLPDSRHHFKNTDTPADTDLKATQNALDAVEQMSPLLSGQ
ncbi:hypothetical protein PY793_04815 [Acetobacter fabarum]|uniref:hypothetical protein n=1 Tax=Acetobacter fabarum TaxID=483199 RepID=UPI00312B3A7A